MWWIDSHRNYDKCLILDTVMHPTSTRKDVHTDLVLILGEAPHKYPNRGTYTVHQVHPPPSIRTHLPSLSLSYSTQSQIEHDVHLPQ